ncbi:unnamed protein product [Pleuronectes platessa]|uniref:Uncharacterized protein n=1 Tax=Pleuronectes platessa TaxID=8262 RepID=A0A9N7Z773_PLEPL|nr:unnamed protein product [Pleuronectes platessa]
MLVGVVVGRGGYLCASYFVGVGGLRDAGALFLPGSHVRNVRKVNQDSFFVIPHCHLCLSSPLLGLREELVEGIPDTVPSYISTDPFPANVDRQGNTGETEPPVARPRGAATIEGSEAGAAEQWSWRIKCRRWMSVPGLTELLSGRQGTLQGQTMAAAVREGGLKKNPNNGTCLQV